jgi:hypothetical protein
MADVLPAICGVCNCNVPMILSFLLGVCGGLVMYFIIKTAKEKRKKLDEE